MPSCKDCAHRGSSNAKTICGNCKVVAQNNWLPKIGSKWRMIFPEILGGFVDYEVISHGPEDKNLKILTGPWEGNTAHWPANELSEISEHMIPLEEETT